MTFRPIFAYVAAACLATAAVSQSPHTRPQVAGYADASASTHFSVFLPLTNRAALDQLLSDQTNSASPSYHRWLTPAEFKSQFGPKAADLAKVKRAFEAAGFTVTAERTQNLEVTGPVWAVERMFSTRLQQVRMPKGSTRLAALNHKLTLPVELAAVGAVIPAFNPSLMATSGSCRDAVLAPSRAAMARICWRMTMKL